MQRWRGKVAIITGASSGIGAAIVENLVDSGITVVGLARRKERLEQLARKLSGKPGKFHHHIADLTKEEDIVKAIKWARQKIGPIGILVNNAGMAGTTTLIDGDTQIWKNVLDTNVMALCIATREVIRSMQADGIDGQIVHINSVTGHKVVNLPNMNVYPASKFAVTALTETLRNELVQAGSKIKITSVSPGLVSTELLAPLFNTADTKDDALQESLNHTPILLPKDIADGISYVLSTPPNVQIQELTIRPVGEAF